MIKINYLFLIVLVWLQYSLWLGKNGVFDFVRNCNINRLYKSIYNLDQIKCVNDQLKVDIYNLLYTDEMVEEYARYYLDMIKLDEVFYQVQSDF